MRASRWAPMDVAAVTAACSIILVAGSLLLERRVLPSASAPTGQSVGPALVSDDAFPGEEGAPPESAARARPPARAGAGEAAPATPPLAPGFPGEDPLEQDDVDERPVVDVQDLGAEGDGRTDDSEAIQRANDTVATAGGGTVLFPAGTYVASGLKQDSYVEFRGMPGAVIRHPDGLSNEQVIRTRAIRTRGSIRAGSSRLTVEDPDRILEGVVVAVRGAGGGSSLQWTELEAPMTPFDRRLRVADPRGLPDKREWTNLLLVGDEMILYRGRVGKELIDVDRGLMGTTPTVHPVGTRVSQLYVHTAVVEAVEGNELTLNRPAVADVVDAKVYVGSIGMSVTGLTLDGNRQDGGTAPGNPFPILYDLARNARVTGNVIRNGGGIRFAKGTRDSSIEGNVFMNNGSPARKGGAAIWLFQGASGNVVRDNEIGGDSVSGVIVDDRTIGSTEFDASSSANLVEDNIIDIPPVGSNSAIAIFGSSDNVVRGNVLRGTNFGVRVYTGGQGPRPPSTSGNLVAENHLRSHRRGIWVDGSGNRFVANTIEDALIPVTDEGSGNRFE